VTWGTGPRLALSVTCSRCGCAWSQLARFQVRACDCTPKTKSGKFAGEPMHNKTLTMIEPLVTEEVPRGNVVV
jgi:hypothetical protein